MSEQTRAGHPIYNLLPTEIEGFDSLAELALDMRWSWNHATDEVWRQLDPELWEITNNPWRHALEQKWAALRFGEIKAETDGNQHVFEVQVYLNDLDPKAVRVELYADGVMGGASVWHEMKRVGQVAGFVGRLRLKRGRVRGPLTSGLYGESDTAPRRRCSPPRNFSDPVAALIFLEAKQFGE